MIWELSNLETKIISVERILQYTSIPSEPPLAVEENRPHDSWPSYGTVDIQNLQVVRVNIMFLFFCLFVALDLQDIIKYE